MKWIAPLVWLAASLPMLAQEPTPDELKNVKTVTIEELMKAKLEYAGRVVRVKFAYRLPKIDKAADGKCAFTLSDGSMADYLKSKAPIEQLAWVTALPVDEKKRTLFVYARIIDGKYTTTAEVLGREIKTDMKGPKLVW